jgi:hypothetical protein
MSLLQGAGRAVWLQNLGYTAPADLMDAGPCWINGNGQKWCSHIKDSGPALTQITVTFAIRKRLFGRWQHD